MRARFNIWGPAKSEKGQMAIFIALIFQVLFVLFAMIINVGLIVHDKINLQNSVDLAAYYAAQRQAEMLNAIAHSNYQIRQAWKLLTYRTRVLGDLGNREHPSNTKFPPASDFVTASETYKYPTTCIIHPRWNTNGGEPQNMCTTTSYSMHKFQPSKVIDVLSPLAIFNILTRIQTTKLRKALDRNCANNGPLNYELLVRWVAAYRAQVAQSKIRIHALSENLSASNVEFKDIQNDSVLEGVKKTLLNNLTRANANGLEEKSVVMFNSLGGIEPKHWLNEMPVFPSFFYTDFNGNNSKCNAVIRDLMSTIPANCGGKCPDWLHDIKKEPSDLKDPYHSSIGYEKNPWFMAYVGVRAVSKPSAPFLPFGKPVVLRATAFAKPFGGRIGPWLYKNWQPGETKSFGGFSDRIDPLLPEPLDPNNPNASNQDPQLIDNAIPNYSRFPGDKLGLKSLLSIYVMFSRVEEVAGTPVIPFESYMGMPNMNGDNLASEFEGQKQGMISSPSYDNRLIPWIREFELAAISPNLFDIAYYSIDPNFSKNYLPKGQVVSTKEFNYDLGFLDSDPSRMSIEKQIMAAVKNIGSDNGGDFFVVKKPEHVLTGWMPAGLFKYDGAGGDITTSFGKCSIPAKSAVPGSCSSGGRVGYSVKIISKDYLLSNDHKIGGVGAGPGPIKNPPDPNF